jgi:hypothetical protein
MDLTEKGPCGNRLSCQPERTNEQQVECHMASEIPVCFAPQTLPPGRSLDLR